MQCSNDTNIYLCLATVYNPEDAAFPTAELRIDCTLLLLRVGTQCLHCMAEFHLGVSRYPLESHPPTGSALAGPVVGQQSDKMEIVLHALV
jgi:hypothetical protein